MFCAPPGGLLKLGLQGLEYAARLRGVGRLVVTRHDRDQRLGLRFVGAHEHAVLVRDPALAGGAGRVTLASLAKPAPTFAR